MSDEDIALNEKYKQQELLTIINNAKLIKDHQKMARDMQAAGGGADNMMSGPDFGGGDTGGFGGDTFGSEPDFGGGGPDFGSGPDFGGGGPEPDFGGGGPEPSAPEPSGGGESGDLA